MSCVAHCRCMLTGLFAAFRKGKYLFSSMYLWRLITLMPCKFWQAPLFEHFLHPPRLIGDMWETLRPVRIPQNGGVSLSVRFRLRAFCHDASKRHIWLKDLPHWEQANDLSMEAILFSIKIPLRKQTSCLYFKLCSLNADIFIHNYFCVTISQWMLPY